MYTHIQSPLIRDKMNEPPNYNIVIQTQWNNELVHDDLF